MKQIITLIAAITFLFPTLAFAETAESKSSPPTIQKIAPNSYYYNYNIQEVQKDPDGDGPLPSETFYQYNYVEIKGRPTKAKVIAAIQAANDTDEADSNTSTDVLTAENDMKDSVFHNKTPAQINAYIDANWDSIATSKATFKKLVLEVYNMKIMQGLK